MYSSGSFTAISLVLKDGGVDEPEDNGWLNRGMVDSSSSNDFWGWNLLEVEAIGDIIYRI